MRYLINFSFYTILLFISVCICSETLIAQNDSIVLLDVEINADSVQTNQNNNALLTTVPVASLSEKEIKLLSANNAADLIRFLPNVQIKDYGGVGGVKTMTIKGLGAQYNKVLYNGIPLLNSQNGVANFGKIPSQNIQKITLSEGGNVSNLQLAQSYASANVLSIESVNPDSNFYIANLGYGSFNHVLGSFNINQKVKKWSFGLFYQYESSDGDFDFTQENGDFDTVLTRTNSAVFSHNLFLSVNRSWENRHLNITSNYYFSEMGLPGPVILYNETPSKQFQDNKTAFIQAKYQDLSHQKWKYGIALKYDYQWLNYIDTNTVLTGAETSNTYQEETYLASITSDYFFNQHLKLYTAIDLNYSNLNQSVSEVKPARTSIFEVIGLKYDLNGRFLFDVNVLMNQNLDVYEDEKTIKTFSTPFIGILYHPSFSKRIALKASFKQAYQMPTFNHLYYVQVGNRDLEAETADIFNFGAVFKLSSGKYINHQISANSFYSSVKNKIVTIPVRNLFYWQTVNYGEVENYGVDAQYHFKYEPNEIFNVKTQLQYTFQKNIDITDENSSTYLNQIPYTPNHIGSGLCSVSYKNVQIGYTIQYTGDRYYILNNKPRYLIPNYTIQNISLLYNNLNLKFLMVDVKLELNNITNQQYEIVKSYPMYGINYMLKINIKL